MDSKIEKTAWRTLLPGSLVKTAVRGPVRVNHFGILDQYYRVISLGNECQVRVQSIEQFAGPNDVFLAEAPNSRMQQLAIFRRIDELPSRARYHFLEWNCEHAARWCFSGVPKSQQVALAGAVVAGAGFAADIISGGKVAEIALFGLLGLGLYLFVKGTPVPEDKIVAAA